jgi:hypothetical protein
VIKDVNFPHAVTFPFVCKNEPQNTARLAAVQMHG